MSAWQREWEEFDHLGSLFKDYLGKGKAPDCSCNHNILWQRLKRVPNSQPSPKLQTFRRSLGPALARASLIEQL